MLKKCQVAKNLKTRKGNATRISPGKLVVGTRKGVDNTEIWV